jgi:hypothetical protein
LKHIIRSIHSEAASTDDPLSCAPQGDSEMLVAQDQVNLQPLMATASYHGPSSPSQVGFSPETMDPGQTPFKAKRDPTGLTLGPPVQATVEFR